MITKADARQRSDLEIVPALVALDSERPVGSVDELFEQEKVTAGLGQKQPYIKGAMYFGWSYIFFSHPYKNFSGIYCGV